MFFVQVSDLDDLDRFEHIFWRLPLSQEGRRGH